MTIIPITTQVTMASDPSPFEGLGGAPDPDARVTKRFYRKYAFRPRSEDPPDYVRQGFGIGIGLMLFGLVLAFVLVIGCGGLVFFLAAAAH